MSITHIQRVLVRDLAALRSEIEAYPDENQLWELRDGISNSGGTLALHLVGNLRHFIGGVLGKTGYVRDRNAEFEDRHVARLEIRAGIDAAMQEISVTLETVTDEELSETYPIEIGGISLVTGQFLVHLVTHLGYHLGQVNYHRRLVTGIGEAVTKNPISALAAG